MGLEGNTDINRGSRQRRTHDLPVPRDGLPSVSDLYILPTCIQERRKTCKGHGDEAEEHEPVVAPHDRRRSRNVIHDTAEG